MQKIEPAIALDVEDKIEFTRILVRQEVASLDAGRGQHHVEPPTVIAHLLDDFVHGALIGKDDAEIMRCTSCASNGFERAVSRLRSLQGGQLFFNQGRRGALATRLEACEEITLQAVLISHE